MELDLKGNIIGVLIDKYNPVNYDNKKVKEIITKKVPESLRMVKLTPLILEQEFSKLSSRNKSKVILASRLLDEVIILPYFTKGLTKNDIEYFKKLFKKINEYNHKIVIIDKNMEMFINCVDKIYVIKSGNIDIETSDIYDPRLKEYGSIPKIVEFNDILTKMNIRIPRYSEFDELLKAIYRIKS